VSDKLIPIEDDELLYRTVSVRSNHCTGGVLSSQAFHPSSRDDSGISVFREKYCKIRDKVGQSADGYYVAVLHAGELRGRGIIVDPKPDVGGGKTDISHAELPQINKAAKKSDTVAELKEVLLELASNREILGPIPPTPPNPYSLAR
jgi:hypothetical protein